jgi:hypothetical protein
MCIKTHATKRFFVLVNVPLPTHIPQVMGVLRNQAMTHALWQAKPNGFLKEKEVEALGYPPSVGMRVHLIPVDIPRDWLLH